MLAILVNANVFLTAGLVVLAALVGFGFRSKQISSLNKKLGQMENEMLASHAEILQLQKEKIDILKSISEPNIPVIPINTAMEEKMEKLQDVNMRKKLLTNTTAKQQTVK